MQSVALENVLYSRLIVQAAARRTPCRATFLPGVQVRNLSASQDGNHMRRLSPIGVIFMEPDACKHDVDLETGLVQWK